MYLGEFEVTSGKLLVTDPCYAKEIWCSHVIENAKPGSWHAKAVVSDEGAWGNRVSELLVWHEDEEGVGPDKFASNEIGVDSGQAGFFDYDKYPEDPGSDGRFYDKACNQTYDEKDHAKQAGIVEGFGVNSSSGYGDGCYSLYIGKNTDGQVVSASLVFISDEDDDDRD